MQASETVTTATRDAGAGWTSVLPVGTALFDDNRTGKPARLYGAPREIIAADRLAEVPAALAAMDRALAAGAHLAGMVSYEAGYAFEPRLRALAERTRAADLGSIRQPLLWFGAYDRCERLDEPAVAAWLAARLTDPISAPHVALTPQWNFPAYRSRCEDALALIAAGDAYQINLTFPLLGQASGDPAGFYAALRGRQPVGDGGLLVTDRGVALSRSPEMFFTKTGSHITTRPMKGTAQRHADPAADQAAAIALARSAKGQAENLMIVDLLRNDLARISQVGSVAVPELFAVETFPTVHQMSSTITARLTDPGLGIADLLAALFPCGSVTGAPKIRAMEIIAALEASPRGVYTGAMGWITPDGHAQLSVAIRTLWVGPDGAARLGVGSGVVADSIAEDEYAECLIKARFVGIEPPISS